MIPLFLAAIYCLADAFLGYNFDIRLRPAHFSLRPQNFWSSGKKILPLFLLCCIGLWIFPFLAIAIILFSKWPHPFLIAYRDLRQKKPAVNFPLSTRETKGLKLFSIPTQDKPHILFVVLESFRAKNLGSLAPNFNRLAEKGVLFTNFHSTGNLTNRSIIASLFGIPAAHRPWHLGHYCNLSLIGLPQILARHGYHPAIIQGGSTSFDHEAEFFEKQGFKTILGKRDIAKPGTSWGVFDEHLMPFAASWLAEQKTPVFLNLTTITNHHPWIHPDGESDYLKTFAYTDYALGLFVDDLKKRRLLEKSILFIFGDHGQELADRDPHFEINRHLYQDNVHVPLLIYAEGRQNHAVIDTVSSQIDLLPTVLDLMDLKDPHHSLGKSLLRPSSQPIFFSHPFDTPILGCRQGNWKYLLQESGEELYDLSVDPDEKINRTGEKEFKEMTLAYFDALDHFYSDQPQQKKEGHLHLNFSNAFITDTDLEQFSPDLASLTLAHCLLITDVGIEKLLKRCPKLEKLEIEGLDEITGQNWAPAPHLIHLKIANCPQMKSGWIQKLPSLMVLQLGSVEIADADLLSFPQQSLTAIYLSNLTEITDRGLNPFLDANPQLMIISLKDCPQITDNCLGSRHFRYQFIS